MNSSRCVATRIKSWGMWTINQDVKNFQVMQHEMKKWLSSLIRIRTIRIMIDQHHVLDLKSLNRVLVRSFNHRHSKIKWIRSIVIIAKNSIISFAIVVNLERWIQTALYEKWMCMKRMTHRVRKTIWRLSRKKNNLCYNRCRDRWDENNENRSL